MDINAVYEATARIVGVDLTGIYFGPFHVRLDFISDTETHVVMKKQFAFMIAGVSHTFDPTDKREANDPAFVGLLGQTCDRVFLDLRGLRLAFPRGSEISVEMSPSDFEPIEILGSRPGVLSEFHYVF